MTASELRRYHRDVFSGRWYRDDPRPGDCVNCDRPVRDFTHGVYEGLAVMFGEVLRNAFWDHLAEHRCNEVGYRGERALVNPGWCPEAERLWGLVPHGAAIG